MAKALEVAKKTIEDREKRLSEYREIILEQMIAVEYTNKVLNSQDTLYTATQIAKELKMTTVRFNKTLQEYRIQYSQNGQWVLYDTYINRDYARNRTFPYTDENGVPRTSTQLMWTEKGRYFIHTILNKEFDGVAVLNSPIFYQ
jgi:phage antirepressor YoqD-like protein